ncbi:MAG: ribonuclease HII [Candidatus Babeliales bacterium]|jgi:ribonuclease HII
MNRLVYKDTFMGQPNVKLTKNFFEKMAWADEHFVCGIDEVGRGCLAGPLVVCAAIVPINTTYRLLKDSKILTEAQRNEAFEWITQHGIWAIGCASPQVIDTINIYQATLFAMKKAYLHLITKLPFPHEKLRFVLVDAMPLKLDPETTHQALEIHHFNYGEKYSSSIAAASIVAKVTRDRLMERIHHSFPAFGFNQHKGYATKQHIEAVHVHGPSLIHRKSFLTNLLAPKDSEAAGQTTLFDENQAL